MKHLIIVLFLGYCIICSFASIEERIADLENVVQGQVADNERMMYRIKELEQEVATLNAEEEDIDNEKDEQHLLETKPIPQHILTRAASTNRAFHAYLSTTNCYNDHGKIIFDVELQDDAGWYDVRDGIYEAREPGIYVFTWTVAAPTNTRVTAELVVGGTMKGVITTDSDKVQNNDGSGSGLHPATAVVVASLSIGDRCFIRVRHLQHNCLSVLSSSSSVRSTFSGWKLY